METLRAEMEKIKLEVKPGWGAERLQGFRAELSCASHACFAQITEGPWLGVLGQAGLCPSAP